MIITSVDSLLFTTEKLKYSFLSFRHLSRTLLTDDMSKREEYGKVQDLKVPTGEDTVTMCISTSKGLGYE